MSVLKEVQESSIIKRPELEVGHTVKVHEKIKEGNKERVQTFQGLVIKINSGHGADKTFTVRRLAGGVGVEKIFPMYSPLIELELVKKAKVRRAKLYYMRDRTGKAARLKETFVSKDKATVQEEPTPAVEQPEVNETPEQTTEAPVEAVATPEENTAPAAEEPKTAEEPATKEEPQQENKES